MGNAFPGCKFIWHNGDFIDWNEAKIHILASAVQFGLSVFEGIKCYETHSGPAVFRLAEHIKRLANSCKIYDIDLQFSQQDLVRASADTVAKNNLGACYIRPVVLRNFGTPAFTAEDSPIDVYIPAWEWGKYLGQDALEKGIDVCVSSWNRPAPNTFPAMAKCAGNYNNSFLLKTEAIKHGYAEAIGLSPDGMVSEGSGQNLFLVHDGILKTSPLDGTNLGGITRDAVMELARCMDIPVQEIVIPRELLYIADELFFTGTASEVTPIRSVDRRIVGSGSAGPLTKRLQAAYFDAVHGRDEAHSHWLTHVR